MNYHHLLTLPEEGLISSGFTRGNCSFQTSLRKTVVRCMLPKNSNLKAHQKQRQQEVCLVNGANGLGNST